MTKKTAVMLVHGMGEQIPMETLESFTGVAWSENPKGAKPGHRALWYKPDQRTGSLDLRRITTEDGVNGKRADFYEFYWADLTDGTTRAHFMDWLTTLILRKQEQVPAAVFHVWIALRALTAFFAIITAAGMLKAAVPDAQIWTVPPFCFISWPLWVYALISALLGFLFSYFLNPYFGDVARYVRAKPANIAVRRAIRERGIELLRRLHDSGKYDRIIVVAHSAGSLVAFEVLSFFWSIESRRRTIMKEDSSGLKALQEVENLTLKMRESPGSIGLETYREAQWRLFETLRSPVREVSSQWLVSDFITLGSPLSHADFLLTFDNETFRNRTARRDIALCPPLLEEHNRFSYQDENAGHTILHHAAQFGAMRWTNIYDKHKFILLGDVISGPVAPLFGGGVRDVHVEMYRQPGKWLPPRLFTHTEYWTGAPAIMSLNPDFPDHIQSLQEALDLARK